MTNGEYATKYGLTLTQLQVEKMAYLQCEGYDDAGNEYETFDAWLVRRKQSTQTLDPVDGGRGSGMLGVEDYQAETYDKTKITNLLSMPVCADRAGALHSLEDSNLLYKSIKQDHPEYSHTEIKKAMKKQREVINDGKNQTTTNRRGKLA